MIKKRDITWVEEVVDTINKYRLRRNTKNLTDVKDYTTLKVLEDVRIKNGMMKVEFEEFHTVNSVCSSRLPLQKTKKDEAEENVGHTRQINKEDEVESDKSESDKK
ncbi:18973_t:CDS:2, partial [Rhizophagus irregularis]